MRHAAAFIERGLGRADVETLVDLKGVGGDDLGGDVVVIAEREGEMEGEVGFAAGGWAADDGDEGWKRRGAHLGNERIA